MSGEQREAVTSDGRQLQVANNGRQLRVANDWKLLWRRSYITFGPSQNSIKPGSVTNEFALHCQR